jgi:hypothetical protein
LRSGRDRARVSAGGHASPDNTSAALTIARRPSAPFPRSPSPGRLPQRPAPRSSCHPWICSRRLEATRTRIPNPRIAVSRNLEAQQLPLRPAACHGVRVRPPAGASRPRKESARVRGESSVLWTTAFVPEPFGLGHRTFGWA